MLYTCFVCNVINAKIGLIIRFISMMMVGKVINNSKLLMLIIEP